MAATATATAAGTRFNARKGQVGYGFSVGVLMLDCNIPFVPGDVGNASTYDFPVQYLLPTAHPDLVQAGRCWH